MELHFFLFWLDIYYYYVFLFWRGLWVRAWHGRTFIFLFVEWLCILRTSFVSREMRALVYSHFDTSTWERGKSLQEFFLLFFFYLFCKSFLFDYVFFWSSACRRFSGTCRYRKTTDYWSRTVRQTCITSAPSVNTLSLIYGALATSSHAEFLSLSFFWNFYLIVYPWRLLVDVSLWTDDCATHIASHLPWSFCFYQLQTDESIEINPSHFFFIFSFRDEV